MKTSIEVFIRMSELCHKISEINIKIMYGLLNDNDQKMLQDDRREYQKELDILKPVYQSLLEQENK